MVKKLLVAMCSFIILLLLSAVTFARGTLPGLDPSEFCPKVDKLVYIPVLPVSVRVGRIVGIRCNTINGDHVGVTDLKTEIKFYTYYPFLVYLPLHLTPFKPPLGIIGGATLLGGYRIINGNLIAVYCKYKYPTILGYNQVVTLLGTKTLS